MNVMSWIESTQLLVRRATKFMSFANGRLKLRAVLAVNSGTFRSRCSATTPAAGSVVEFVA
ncbi:MAG: hypothetical protein ABI145_21445 [Steroidobacteraceae bacterium]